MSYNSDLQSNNTELEEILDAKLVQQKIKLYTNIPLKQGDILRMKV